MHKIKRVLGLVLGMLAAACLTEKGLAETTFINTNYGLAPVYDGEGNLLFGTNFVAMIYGGATVDTLRPGRTSPTSVVAPVPFDWLPGYFLLAGIVYVDSELGCDGGAWVQVRVWDIRLGPTYEAVAALGIGGYGESNIFFAYGGNPCPTPSQAQFIVGLESFSVRPELHLDAPRMQPEAFAFAVHGPAGMEVVVDRSTNLLDWVSWQSLTLGEAPTTLSDTNAPCRRLTFYRARKAP